MYSVEFESAARVTEATSERAGGVSLSEHENRERLGESEGLKPWYIVCSI